MAKLLNYQDALKQPEAPWTVSGVLGGLGLLWGEAGVGKSFVACGMAASVATGRHWLGHKVAEGPVVYIAGEGGAPAVARRLDAAVTALRCCDEDEPVPLWLVVPGVDLVAGSQELLQLMDGIEPQLIVVDTLARCFGGDENSGTDMGAFVRTLDGLREMMGGSALVVHHANKTDRAGGGRVRGHSSLYGAVDVSLQLQHAAAGEMALYADKLKDREGGLIAELRLEPVPSPGGELDELGDVRTTLVTRPSARFDSTRAEVAMVAINSVVNYESWRAALPNLDKRTFDRLVVAILSDPQTWGIEEIGPGVFGTAITPLPVQQ